MLHRFANPNRFMRLSAALLPWTAGLTLVLLIAGLFLALFGSPADYQQGETVRIMYVHVPAAWMALFFMNPFGIGLTYVIGSFFLPRKAPVAADSI